MERLEEIKSALDDRIVQRTIHYRNSLPATTCPRIPAPIGGPKRKCNRVLAEGIGSFAPRMRKSTWTLHVGNQKCALELN